MPRVMVGFGSASEVACALPFRANIADGFALESLELEPEEYQWYCTRQVVGMVSQAIGNELRRQSSGVAWLEIQQCSTANEGQLLSGSRNTTI